MTRSDQGRLNPVDAGLVNAALKDLQSGRLREAEGALRQVLNRHPDEADAVHLLGLVALQRRDFPEAERLLGRATQLDRRQPAAWNNLGVALREQGKLAEAVAAYRKALAVAPDFTDALSNLGGVLNRLGQTAEALPALRRAVAIQPDHAEALNNLGSALFHQGALRDAEGLLRQALQRAPRLAEAWNNLGNVLAELDRLDDAIAAYHAALRIQPRHPEALANLGLTLHARNRTEEAIAALHQALALRPDYAQAESTLLHLSQITCDWAAVAALSPRVDAATQAAIAAGRRPSEPPFVSVGRCDDSAVNFAIARAWADDMARHYPPAYRHPAAGRRRNGERLTIGYVSSDLGEHAVGHLMRGQFRNHDRDRFRIHLYTKLLIGSPHREQVVGDGDLHRDIDHMDPADVARRIHDDGVDILVHLNGWTKHHSLTVCAFRPAPIQAEHVGYPGTTGADFIDYNIVDSIVAPPEHAAFYREKLVHLPHCYQPNDNRQRIADGVLTRADCALPESGMVFASFNQSFKFDPLMWSAWMRLLAAVPGSVLWLLTYEGSGEANLRRAAEAAGVDAARLIFAPKMPKAEHLRRIQLADLCLDTRIYTGHTTTSDVLWTGVPVVALRGRHFASLVSTSGLTAMGLADLVTESLSDYEALALRLARDPAARAGLRARIAANRATSPLFDTARFVRNLELAYDRMWEIYCDGLPPRPIRIVDGGGASA